eukprot:1154062-Pelagomonas_calceolata.AAC.3
MPAGFEHVQPHQACLLVLVQEINTCIQLSCVLDMPLKCRIMCCIEKKREKMSMPAYGSRVSRKAP